MGIISGRATSAAPTYFRPFVNKRTNEGYLDGALFHNNLSCVAYHESKLVWPDVQDCHADILLSIGTSHNSERSTGSLEAIPGRLRRMKRSSDLSIVPEHRDRRINFGAWFKNVSILQALNVMVSRVDNILNSEQIWQNFKNDVLPSSKSVDQHYRYQIIIPGIGQTPPRLDDKGRMESLQTKVIDVLRKKSGYKRKIAKVAHRLVASSFTLRKWKRREKSTEAISA